MRRLTPLQSSNLFDLMAALRGLPTPNLVAESARLQSSTPADEEVKRRFRNQLAGAFAVHTLDGYRSSVLAVNERREAIGAEIHRRFFVYRQAMGKHPEIAAKVLDEAIDLRNQQETLFHFIAICGMKFFQLLPLAASAAGPRVPDTDLQALEAYEHLRHYYEHLDKEFPGKGNSQTSVREADDGMNWSIRMGLPRDEQERLLVRQARAPYTIWTVDVSKSGVDLMLEIADRNLRAIRESALSSAREYFTSYPWIIPSPDDLKVGPLVQMNMWVPD